MVARGGPAGAAARAGGIGRPVTAVPARGDNRVGEIHRARSAGVLTKLLSRYAPLGLLGLLLVMSAARLPVAAAETGAVHVARLSGIVDPVVAQYLIRAIERAEREDAAGLIVLLDTPGGLDSATRAIIQRMLAAAVPVVVYVTPSGARAASAGMFVTLAAHLAAMTPGTSLGAEHLIGSRIGPIEPVMAGKVTSDAASTARALATQRGRDEEWVDRAVREGSSATDAEALAAPRTGRR